MIEIILTLCFAFATIVLLFFIHKDVKQFKKMRVIEKEIPTGWQDRRMGAIRGIITKLFSIFKKVLLFWFLSLITVLLAFHILFF